MVTGLLHAHSGLRYVVLLLALAFLAVCIAGLVQKTPFSRQGRILGSAFLGLFHLQVVLGLVMVALGIYYPALIGHLVLMLAAAVVGQVLVSLNRRRAEPGWQLPLAAVVSMLLLVTGGTFAIGRHPLQSKVLSRPAAEAAP